MTLMIMITIIMRIAMMVMMAMRKTSHLLLNLPRHVLALLPLLLARDLGALFGLHLVRVIMIMILVGQDNHHHDGLDGGSLAGQDE